MNIEELENKIKELQEEIEKLKKKENNELIEQEVEEKMASFTVRMQQ